MLVSLMITRHLDAYFNQSSEDKDGDLAGLLPKVKETEGLHAKGK